MCRHNTQILTNYVAIGVVEDKNEVKFGHLIQNVMEDAQGRLVFRSQMYIHNDIQNYQPKPQDFENVQTKVISEENQKSSVVLDATATATLTIEEDTSSETHSIHSARSNLLADGSDNSCGWFPTLQKTLWILSKLYRCVQVIKRFLDALFVYILRYIIIDWCV